MTSETKKKRLPGPVWLPQAHFGDIGGGPPEDAEPADDDSPDDDEELAETPNDVTMMLGFDPLDGFE